jgi:hypothetical protein
MRKQVLLSFSFALIHLVSAQEAKPITLEDILAGARILSDDLGEKEVR